MKSVLFIIPLKKGCVDQYKSILKQAVRRKKEYSDCLRRYDLRSAKAWVKSLGGKDYAYIYHDVGENFQEKLKGFGDSTNPFDRWFRERLMSVYEADPTEEDAVQVLDFNPNND